jgi:HD-like signal output (HDOD) protein
LDYDEFWHHSVSTGMVAGTEGVHRDAAFTAGVLHNIGLLAMDQERPDLLTASLEYARTREMTRHEAQRELRVYTDSDPGDTLAAAWSLPAELTKAISDHAMSLETLPDDGTLTAFMLPARLLVRSQGMGDGIEHPELGDLPTRVD